MGGRKATPEVEEAALGAVQQARSGERSLLDNEAMRQQLAGGTEGLYGLTFYDTPRMIQSGYGLTSLM